MLELGKNTSAAPVIEGSDATFASDVLDASRNAPVIAYFSAAWCGPCKTFGPELEAAVGSTGGKVTIVKIDLDANRRVAAQLGIQSIPAVFGFFDRRPVDGFVGARNRREIDEFVSKLVSLSGVDTLADTVAAAQALLDQGAVVEAAQAFAAILGSEPNCAPAYAGLVRSHLALGDVGRANELLAAIPEPIFEEKAVVAARAAVDLALHAKDVGPTGKLRECLTADPSNIAVRFDLSVALLADGDKGGAIDELLEIIRRDREWNDGAARTQLLKIFDSLAPSDPIALKGRRAYSSMVFS